MKIQKNISATLKAVMTKRNRTLAEFAEEIGIAKSSLQDYLKAKSNPRADTIELISRKLGISPAELVGGPEAKLKHMLEFTQDDKIHPLLIPLVEKYHILGIEILRVSNILSDMDNQNDEPDCVHS